MHRKMAVLLAVMILGHTMEAFAREAEEVMKSDVTEASDDIDPEELVRDEVTSNVDMIEETDNADAAEKVSGETLAEEVLYNVSFPADIHAFLDPGNLSGKGQVFSGRYKVENYGNTDVDIRIKDIDVYCLSTEDVYEFSEEEITDHSSRIKKINIDMIWENEAEQTENILHVSEGVFDEPVLSLKAAEYDENGEFVSLCEGGAGIFYFTGTLNANPNLVWEDGELIVRFGYEIIGPERNEQAADDDQDAETDQGPEASVEMMENPADTGNEVNHEGEEVSADMKNRTNEENSEVPGDAGSGADEENPEVSVDTGNESKKEGLKASENTDETKEDRVKISADTGSETDEESSGIPGDTESETVEEGPEVSGDTENEINGEHLNDSENTGNKTEEKLEASADTGSGAVHEGPDVEDIEKQEDISRQ